MDQSEYIKQLERFDQGDFTGDEQEDPFYVKLAIWGSFMVNVGLTIAKLTALISSGSISVLASFLDSVLDLLSGSVIFLTSLFQKVGHKEALKWPVGKRRLETLAVLVFAATMFTATAQILVEGAKNLIQQENIDLNVSASTIGILAGTVGIKLILWVLCSRVKNITAQALAEDHRNDVFSNFVAVATVLGGFYWRPWLDPLGGILIAIYIMNGWFDTGLEYVHMMTGKSASPELLSKLTYIAYKHDPRIRAIDTVRAYSITENYIVELDIVLSPELQLRIAHDIGESLQMKLEMLPEVERAFVHLDHECTHRAHDEHVIY
eukprot:TRINITY_DN8240_c0_g1_i9.p1 TRINITY_DN8240_c0_g1~~TRINITY_DN8240_c0_g1_i9.p1  ORF type:complete len:321 (-),score=54.06 TRINITY_DN8240_c0_g1_i9:112-1074(-)